MWLKEDGFVDKAREWWRSYDFSASSSFMLKSKLKALKKDIKMWNQEVFGNLNFRKSSFLYELSSLDGLHEGWFLDYEGKE